MKTWVEVMQTAKLSGVELQYEVIGSGDDLLLISTGPIADSFLPFLSEPALADQYRLIRYHQRGQRGGTSSSVPVSFAQHAADASELLDYLGIRRAHVAGHSTGGDIALELAHARSDLVHTLALLEPALMDVPSAAAFFDETAPALASFRAGHHERAMEQFLTLVCGLDWERCKATIETRIPGGVAQAVKDAHTFFSSYLPALTTWKFDAAGAAAISQPILSVLGTKTEQLFTEGRDLVHAWFPQTEDLTIEGVGHLLHIQQPEPVARGMAAFFDRYPMSSAQRGTRSTHLIRA
jgi:3-oxoadipate enol-lactonase